MTFDRHQEASTTRTVTELVNILRRQEAKNLTDIKLQTISQFVQVKVSLFEGLSLPELIVAKKARCKEIHNNVPVCSRCSPLIDAANIIVLNENPVPLPYLWNKCFCDIPYNSEKARRKILQMPVCAVYVNGTIYVAQKKVTSEEYSSLANTIHSDMISRKKSYIPREDYEVLLSVAQGETEKKILKHTLCSTQNLSRRQARQLYGISKLQERADTVNKAVTAIKEIKDRHSALAKSEQKRFLLSCGESIDDYLTSSSESCDETESEVSSSDDSSYGIKDTLFTDVRGNKSDSTFAKDMTDTIISASNTQVATHLLREVSFNWFAFVILLRSKFASEDEFMVDSLIIEVASHLPELGFSKEEVGLIEQSRAAYLQTMQENENAAKTISISSGDSSTDVSEGEQLEYREKVAKN